MRASRPLTLATLLAIAFLAFAPFAAHAANDCLPVPLGTAALYTSDSVNKPHADGTWGVWFCTDAYSVSYNFRVERFDHKTKFPAIGAASTPVQVWNAYQKANLSVPCTDASIASLCKAAEAWAIANQPATPAWVVAKNGTTATRPTYNVVYDAKGVPSLGSANALRATVGAECDVSQAKKRVINGTTTYGEVRGFNAPLPAVVAVCTKAPTP